MVPLPSATQCKEVAYLDRPIRSLGIGSYISSDAHADNPYHPVATATMQTTVFDVVHMFSELGISAVPIVDKRGRVINLYETVDVIVGDRFSPSRERYLIQRLSQPQTLVRSGGYHDLDLTIAQALARRAPDFPGVLTCHPDDSLAAVFALIRMRRVHRLVVVEGFAPVEGEPDEERRARAERKGRLLGIISLSDILRHVIVSWAFGTSRRDACSCS